MRTARLVLLPLLLLVLLPVAEAAPAMQGLSGFTGQAGGEKWSLSLQTLMLLSAMAFLPAVLLMMTGFTRIIIVLGLLRTAIGTTSAPPNQVLLGLALFLTFFVMSPTLEQAYQKAWVPFSQDQMGVEQFLDEASQPFRTFMLAQTRQADLALYVRLARIDDLKGPEDVPMRVLLPAFVTSELKTAFEIGFLIFIPFVIIDLVVASVLMSMGMMMLSPMLVSAPFKILLFVLVDGWVLTVGTLAASFNPA